MTPEEYVALGGAIQGGIVSIIDSAVNHETPNLARILGRDPVNLEDAQWLASLVSPADKDAHGDKRVHAWLVTFAAADDPETSATRSIEPVFNYRVQLFYTHDFGTDASNSEARVRAEILRAQLALAQSPKLNLPGVKRHRQLRMRLRLARLGGVIVHRGDGEITVEAQPFNVY